MNASIKTAVRSGCRLKKSWKGSVIALRKFSGCFSVTLGSEMISENPTLMSMNAPVMKKTVDQGKKSDRINAREPGIHPEIR